MNYSHLVYVRKYSILSNTYELYVYGVHTSDIFHTMGEMMYRSETQIKWIDFVELTKDNMKSKLDFWKNENKEIHTWIDKYH